MKSKISIRQPLPSSDPEKDLIEKLNDLEETNTSIDFTIKSGNLQLQSTKDILQKLNLL